MFCDTYNEEIQRHKWKWHKKTEHAAVCLSATGNTKTRVGALIVATEWRAQSNWISSAVSSNLIWPALWRMTEERNTFSCLLPTTPSVPTSLWVCPPHRATGRRAASTKQLANICCVGCLRWLLHRCSLRALRQPLPQSDVPQTTLAFSCLSHTSATFSWVLQTLKGHGREMIEGGAEVMEMFRQYQKTSQSGMYSY